MYPTIFYITDTIAIQSYGVAIAIGLYLAFKLAEQEVVTQKIISTKEFERLIFLLIASVLIGGRLWHIITEQEGYSGVLDMLLPSTGGFSIMGSTLSALIIGIPYAYYRMLPLWYLFDLVGSYAPLIQSFGRIGCFFAGCCFGKATTIFWAITYRNTQVFAPCNIPLHPTQLYSAAIFFCIFLILFMLKKRSYQPGTLGLLYLMGASSERFFIDFLRGDPVVILAHLSINQWAALIIFSAAFSTYLYRRIYNGPLSVS